MSERDEFLAQAMGIKSDIIFCPQADGIVNTYDITQSLSTWQGFGILFEWAQKQKWWNDESFFTTTSESHITDSGCCVIAMGRLPYIINPSLFANAVYEFLKGRDQ